jgi:hypothetical protein
MVPEVSIIYPKYVATNMELVVGNSYDGNLRSGFIVEKLEGEYTLHYIGCSFGINLIDCFDGFLVKPNFIFTFNIIELYRGPFSNWNCKLQITSILDKEIIEKAYIKYSLLK